MQRLSRGAVVLFSVSSCAVLAAGLRDGGTVASVSAPDAGVAVEGFQRTTWGQSPQDVRRLYPQARPLKSGDLFYVGEVAGHNATVIFTFTHEKLSSVLVNLNEKRVNPNDYLSDFDDLRKLLSKKYGAAEERTKWKDEVYRDQKSKWGLAVAQGALVMGAAWQTPLMDVQLGCAGEKFEVSITLRYASRALAEEERQLREKSRLDDL